MTFPLLPCTQRGAGLQDNAGVLVLVITFSRSIETGLCSVNRLSSYTCGGGVGLFACSIT